MKCYWKASDIKTQVNLSELNKEDRDFILQQTLNGMLMSGALSTEEYDIFSKDLTKFHNYFKLTPINKTKEK